MMDFRQYIKNNLIILDGGTGTVLQSKGLVSGELPERWNMTHPDDIVDLHRSYFYAGSNVVNTNTFGANILKFSEAELEEIISSAIANAKRARELSTGSQQKFIALDIGPTGKMLKPLGELDFEDAVSVFSETVKLGIKYGVDLVFIETMSDSLETKAALLAVKENCDLPVMVSNAYGEDGKLMTGADPGAMVALLEGMGADAIGVNCSLGPRALAPIVEEYLKYSSIPVILKPNAGLPKVVDGKTVFDISPDEFSDEVSALVNKGVRIVGGCCGTTPDYIRAVSSAISGCTPEAISEKDYTCVSSYSHAVYFGENPVLIGERINPTGKKKFKEALRANDMDYILKEGIAQQEKGVHILDVNVGLPEIDEVSMLTTAVCRLQEVTDLPLQIDTSDAVAMESALRRYNGKAMINSVNGKEESMNTVFPLVKKYGGLVVALTLDESGIPATSEGRVRIARKILRKAEEYGIKKKDIIFDPLALTISADNSSGRETLEAVKFIRNNLGCHTSLGVSNVSFGLPRREIINSNFFTLALWQGLSGAIMNPYSDDMMKSYFAYCALKGLDDNCQNYVAFTETLPETVSAQVSAKPQEKADTSTGLKRAVIKGLKEQSASLTDELLKERDALDIVRNEIIPALDEVGIGFENKTVYLPQLLMSAEAAKSSFERIKASMGTGKSADKCAFVIATVKGDIHDIGKNIVKLLLENYGFDVYDLGKDVAPETVVDKVTELNAPLVGLSALMTTTVPAMEETIKLLREKAPWCRIVVGGAVLTQEYADSIGADKYAKDAMETVRYAEEINKLI